MHQVQRQLKVKRLLLLGLGMAMASGGLVTLHDFQKQRQAEMILNRARDAVAAQNWEAAQELYQQYLQYHPRDGAALQGYATALEELAINRPALARQSILVTEQLLRIDPTQNEFRHKLAKRYLDAGLYPNAREHLRYLLNLTKGGQSQNAEILELAARCELLDGRNYPQAVAYLEKAIQTGQARTEAYLQLALILWQQIATEEARHRAEAVLDDLIRSRPDDLNSRLARAKFWVQTGDVTKAESDLEQAARLPGAEKHLELLLAQAELALGKDDLARAKNLLTLGLQSAPDDVRLRLRLSEVLSRLNEREAAREVLSKIPVPEQLTDLTALEIADRLLDLGDVAAARERVVRLQNNPATVPLGDYLLGRVHLHDGNWPAALTLLKGCVTALGRMPQYQHKAYLALGQCYSLANNPDQQLLAYSAARQLSPASISAKLGEADALAKLGRLAEAIAAYQALSAELPGARAPLCRLRLAEILSRSPQHRDWDGLNELFGTAPHLPEIELIRAQALYHQGRSEDSLRILQEAAARCPADPRLLSAQALLIGEKNSAEALRLLTDADSRLGDHLPLRLARAQLLARQNQPSPQQLLAIAEDASGFTTSERIALWTGVAELLVALGHRQDAIRLYERVAQAALYDIPSRLTLFDLALSQQQSDLQLKMLEELARLDGQDGPIYLVAETAREIATAKAGDIALIPKLREKLFKARQKRQSWSRITVLLGDLALLEQQPDVAIQHYRQAFHQGERSDHLVRKLVRLLLDRQHHPEALAILNQAGAEARLAPDLAKQRTLLQSVMGENRKENLAWARSDMAERSRDYREHLFRATVFAVNNAPAEAKAALQKAVALNDRAPETWIALVRFLTASGQQEEAKAAVEQARQKLKPGQSAESAAIVALTLGACHEFLGNMREAETMYREAHRLTPNDPAILRQLVVLLQRSDRKSEAAALLETAIRPEIPAAVRRWARRTLAFSMVAGPDGFSQLPAAVALLDENLREGGNLVDDQRAKFLVLAVDPFQRAQALAGLIESSRTIPLGPEENFLLGKLHWQNGDLDRAEAALHEATRSGGLANPEHLALLVRVQLDRGHLEAAKETVERLKLVAPGSWEAIAEEARYLARIGRKAEAGKLAFSAAQAAEAAFLLARVGPLLEAIDCPAEAEKAYRQYAGLVNRPDAHVPLAAFYLRQGRPAEAIALARSRQADCPVGTTARLLSGAIRSRPPELVPVSERPDWDQTVTTAVAWVDAKLKDEPKNPDLLFARAELHDALGRFDDEMRAYEAALAQCPDHEVYLNNLALLLALHHRDQSARPLELINRAIRRRGPQPYFLDTRAVIHTVAGRLDEAEKDLDAAIALAPRPVYFFHLAILHDQANRIPARDAALGEARQQGLTKAMLHPKEWPDFDRLFSPRTSSSNPGEGVRVSSAP